MAPTRHLLALQQSVAYFNPPPRVIGIYGLHGNMVGRPGRCGEGTRLMGKDGPLFMSGRTLLSCHELSTALKRKVRVGG